ncbi:SoxR reducing system RseC family protein [Pseudidiomarina taiwanensis]|uniref:Fis family transcriptional regulator n=1 Tax=Pseudidiomarina taiwanensis TaxID=337250 RepID=A0A432ZNJ2_9GAMM|nr:SoxR reducing system RseC family protein [Pseudidiomarina taiwanensis]RUO79465.1 Fis family transcriptional regulator [Pseudidiomarina taiwanensis]
MVREQAQVIALSDAELTLTTQLKMGCSGCQQQSSCGAGIISKAFSDRRAVFTVPRPLGFNAAIGETVTLELPEQALTRYSLLLYGAPLAALLGMSLLSQALGTSEGASIVLAFMAMGLSFIGLRKWLRHRDVQVQQLLKVTEIS